MDEAPEETGRRQIYKDLGVDFFGFWRRHTINCVTAVSFAFRIFFFRGDSDDYGQ